MTPRWIILASLLVNALVVAETRTHEIEAKIGLENRAPIPAAPRFESLLAVARTTICDHLNLPKYNANVTQLMQAQVRFYREAKMFSGAAKSRYLTGRPGFLRQAALIADSNRGEITASLAEQGYEIKELMDDREDPTPQDTYVQHVRRDFALLFRPTRPGDGELIVAAQRDRGTIFFCHRSPPGRWCFRCDVEQKEICEAFRMGDEDGWDSLRRERNVARFSAQRLGLQDGMIRKTFPLRCGVSPTSPSNRAQ